MGAVATGLDEALVSRLHAELERAGLDGLLIVAESSHDPDLAPFVGSAHLGDCFLVVPRDGEVKLGFLTDMEREEAAGTGLSLLEPEELGVQALVQAGAESGELWRGVLKTALECMALTPTRFGVGGHPAAGTIVEACSELEKEGWRWQSVGEILRRWRKFKPPAWIDRFDRPAAGVRAAMRRIADLLAAAAPGPGGLRVEGELLTVGRLRETASLAFARHGLSEPEGNIMAAGADGGVPHTRGDSSRTLQAGEPLVVDLFPCGEVFADCTRTFCVGEPGERFREAFGHVRTALERAHAAAQPGTRGWDLQTATCDLFEAAGYATSRSQPGTRTGYVHGLGHGVGYELHEYPSFRQHSGEEGVLAVGDVLTLEPGLYDAEAGYGVRLEDLCYLGDEGLSNLTPLPLEWDPGAWVD